MKRTGNDTRPTHEIVTPRRTRLPIQRQSIRALSDAALTHVAGGSSGTGAQDGCTRTTQ